MTPVSEYLKILRWSPSDLADQLEVNPRTVFRWVNGQNETPILVLIWLRELVQFHKTHDKPEGWIANGE